MNIVSLLLVVFFIVFNRIPSDEIINACLTRQSIAPFLLEGKLKVIKPIQHPEMIEGEWEVIASLMTWYDEEAGYAKSTFGYGEYGKDYHITYKFLKEKKGTRTSDDSTIDIVWELRDSNKKLYTKNGYDVENEMWIRMNNDTIELISSPLPPNSMYMYHVLKRIK